MIVVGSCAYFLRMALLRYVVQVLVKFVLGGLSLLCRY